MYTEPSCVATTLLSNTPFSLTECIVRTLSRLKFLIGPPLTEGSNNGCGWLHHRSVASSKQTWTWTSFRNQNKPASIHLIHPNERKARMKKISLTLPTHLLPYRFNTDSNVSGRNIDNYFQDIGVAKKMGYIRCSYVSFFLLQVIQIAWF